MKKQGKVRKHNKNSLIDQSNLSNHEPKDFLKGSIDKSLHGWLSHFSGWLSSPAVLAAYSDWLIHFNNSPGKKLDIINEATKQSIQFLVYIMHACSGQKCEPCIEVKESDHRFQNPLWEQFPFNICAQSFLMNENIWNEATTNIRGVSKHHENMVNFTAKQILDMFAPSNFPILNPEVIEATINEGGANFVNGLNNWVEDVLRKLNKQPPAGSEQFKVGENIAITPGKVVYRNHLIELIQYEPTTSKVYPEPILIIPAWIMKYYILDLSPNNSMVKYLVDQGHTVFMISWRNPDEKDRDLTMVDYINLGAIDAMKAISHIVPQQKIHSVGYCLGGTLLILAAASIAKEKDNPLESITLFASQVDFKDAGELMLFIDESQIAYLEDIMWKKGYLDGQQMAGTFSMLQSIDLIWSKIMLDYQLGKRRPINDLMAWDYDTTRLPYAMHSEYLRKLFLNNDLIEGHYKVNGNILTLQDIDLPIFAESALRDQVAPWKSVYKIHYFTDTDFTFVLTNGGHNSGVVNEPGHPGRSYQLMAHKKGEKDISPELWQQKASQNEGSWWPAWQAWLASYSGEKVLPPALGNAKQGYKILCDAPGIYVLQK